MATVELVLTYTLKSFELELFTFSKTSHFESSNIYTLIKCETVSGRDIAY